MTEITYPPFRQGKDIEVRFAQTLGNISCNFAHLVRAFGRPTFDVSNNDSFEGTEQCSWHIQFQTGQTAIIAEVRPFGTTPDEDSFELSKTWKINSRFPQVMEWIKQIIRDANPMG